MSYTIVGVAGHIDHGKTTLVRALSGVDTDTNPEEKRRGITIDLGFASFELGEHRFALIDAPGHQKYIGNLLAGVSAIDIGLLVVAADQGIQQQTLEHAAIVRALGVKKLIVAVSRIDLVDQASLGELAEELELFLGEFGFTDIPTIFYSAVSGVGIDELKNVLCQFAEQSAKPVNVESPTEMFRLPVDRVFNVPGRGLVIAGTIWSGSIATGDVLELAGTGEQLRVRELEVHGKDVQSSQAGFRTAMNVVGGSHVSIRRGDELVTPGSHVKSQLLVVAVEMFPEAADIRLPATVHLHTGTLSCSARMLGVKRLSKGSRDVVIVQPEQPLVACLNQACLFRRPYPVGSFAGGRVLAALEGHRYITRKLLELGRHLESEAPSARLAAWVDFREELPIDLAWLTEKLGVTPNRVQDAIESLVSSEQVIKVGTRLISPSTVARVEKSILKFMENRSDAVENAWIVEQSIVEKSRRVASAELVKWTVERLVGSGRLVRLNDMLAIACEQTKLSKKQRGQMDAIFNLYEDDRSPPTQKEVAELMKLTLDGVTALTRFGIQQGLLVDLGQGFIFSKRVFETLCQELRTLFGNNQELSVAAIRDCWQLTRKHVIPLLEYCDRQAITIRRGNERTAGPELDRYCNATTSVEPTVGQS